jgi:hypothetical protein
LESDEFHRLFEVLLRDQGLSLIMLRVVAGHGGRENGQSIHPMKVEKRLKRRKRAREEDEAT